MKLTQRRIETLECPAGRRDMMVFDDEQSGLGLRVTVGGGKSFLVQYRHAGEKRRVPLGSCSAISLASAREAARAILGDVAKGRDPAAERKQAIQQAKARADQEALTLGVLVDQWEAGHLAEKRAGYRVEATRALRFAFKSKLGKPAADLDPGTVKREVYSIAAAGKLATARLTAAYGRACYGWAIGAGLLETNPFHGVRLNAVPSRERVLTDVELAAIWKAADGPGSYDWIVRLLILTGQRRDEVAGMTWNEITDDLSAWTISADRAKNGVAHIVPLSPQARAILRAAPRYEGADPVFPGRRGPFNGFGKAKAALDEASGVEDWRLHDLRRTVATGLQRLGVRLEVTESVLNHISGSRAGIVGVYQRHTWADEKRAALNAWGAHIHAIVEGREATDNVTAFRAPTHEMADGTAAPLPKGYQLNDEQRRQVADCLAKDGLRLQSDRFQCFVRDVEASIADFLLSARGASFRDAHDALRRLWNLSHEDVPSDEALSKLVRALPRRAAEYLNRRGPMGIDPDQLDALKNWEPDVNPETLLIRVLSGEGVQIVSGRSRGGGKRSGQRAEPIIMGQARGSAWRMHTGGRPKSAEEEDLVISLALNWLHAREHPPTRGRSDRSGFGDLVHSVFQWIGLTDGSAAYALRQYWSEVARGRKAPGAQEPA